MVYFINIFDKNSGYIYEESLVYADSDAEAVEYLMNDLCFHGAVEYYAHVKAEDDTFSCYMEGEGNARDGGYDEQ